MVFHLKSLSEFVIFYKLSPAVNCPLLSLLGFSFSGDVDFCFKKAPLDIICAVNKFVERKHVEMEEDSSHVHNWSG